MFEFVNNHWKWIVGVVSGTFGLGVAQSLFVKKKELYKKDGSQIYTPRDEFKKTVAEISKENKAQAETMRSVNFKLGQIDQFMKDHVK